MEAIAARIESLAVLPTLQAKSADFIARLQRYVWPALDGCKHESLLFYFKMLAGCSAPEAKNAAMHTTLLKKLASFAQGSSAGDVFKHIRLFSLLKFCVIFLSLLNAGLDYKKLISSAADGHDVIRAIVTPANVNQLAKLAAKIPMENGEHLSASAVHCAWALKQFWEGASSNRKAQRGEPPTQAAWVHRYNTTML